VRCFLKEFLGDPLVVDLNRVLWWCIRNLVILPFRSRSSARLYQKIWTDEGSPLIAISGKLRDRVARQLLGICHVELAMRYGEPSIERGLQRLLDLGCRDILVLPLFPQVSITTTGTIEREVRRVAGRISSDGRLSFAAPWFAHQAYISSVAAMIRVAMQRKPVDHVVLSLHGIPVRYVEAGDPYRDHCEATAAALAAELALAPGSWTLAYQSRFGREPWLEPDTVDVVTELGQRGRRVLVACPGFTADCLETLEEIGQRLRADFEAAGGEELVVVPCLNDNEAWVEGLARIVTEELEAGADAAHAAGQFSRI